MVNRDSPPLLSTELEVNDEHKDPSSRRSSSSDISDIESVNEVAERLVDCGTDGAVSVSVTGCSSDSRVFTACTGREDAWLPYRATRRGCPGAAFASVGARTNNGVLIISCRS